MIMIAVWVIVITLIMTIVLIEKLLVFGNSGKGHVGRLAHFQIDFFR